MAKRLIDADKLMARAIRKKPEPGKTRYVDGYNDALMVMRSMIHGEPTVDAVEVVRCRECKKRSPSVTAVKDAVWCRELMAYMPADGFCSYGERKEK